MPRPSSGHDARRRDIDGLRAVAVLAVVAFHAVPRLLPGGFTGVDVFFVISGYVITQLIDNELESGEFTFLGFYQRRIRRIIPPLLIVSSVTLVVFFFLFTPFNFKKLGQSALASSLFWANHYFRVQAGYFAGPVRERPLLHTWSLSVEEQFYMAWPVLLWLGHRFLKRRALILGFTGIVLCSLFWSEHLARTAPDDAFYSIFSRAWELGLGALAALGRKRIDSLRDAEWLRGWLRALPIGGVLLIGYGFEFTNNASFPGLHALPACLGTLLVIIGNGTNRSRTLVSTFLESPPVVYVGRLSYSLYLWHWPTFCAAFLLRGNEPSGMVLALSVVMAVFFALLSYHLVEVPLRQKVSSTDFRISNGKVLPACAMGGAVIVFLGLAAHKTQGFAPRTKTAGATQPIGNDPLQIANPGCRPLGTSPACAYESTTSTRTVLVWGDSHAAVVGRVLRQSDVAARFRIVVASKGACPPTMGVRIFDQRGARQTDCESFNRDVLSLARSSDLAAVVISARWSLYQPTDLIANRPVGSFVLLAGDSVPGSGQVSVVQGIEAAVSHGLSRSVPILLLGQPPEFLLAPANCALSRYASRLMDGQCDIARERLGSWEDIRQRLATLAASPRVAFLDLLPSFCPDRLCSGIDRRSGDLLYEDDNHLNDTGGARIAGQVSATLDRLVAVSPAPAAARN